MSQRKSSLREVFKEDTEKLFERILIVANVFCAIMVLTQLFAGNSEELFFTLAFLLVFVIDFILFRTGHKVFAYHLIVLSVCFLYLYQVVIGGAKYEAILLFYPSALLYCFVFFDRLKTLYFYFGFLLINQLIILYFNSGANETGVTFQFFAEFFNVIGFGVLTFLSATYYFNSLKRTKIKLDQTIDEILLQESILKKKEKEKAVMNKKFAELELQALQAQMNPHFIFNSLQAIQDFVVGKDERAANKYLVSFSKLMRLFLESSKEKYITLEEELKLLELYMELEQLRFEPPFDYEIYCPNSIDWGAVEIPSMLLQPFVENAINHGLRYKKGKGFVKIKIREEGEKLFVHIIDNGVGVKKAKEIKDKATKSYKSRSMEIIEERLRTVQFIDNVKIKIEVKDRLIDNQIQGTIVEITCPFLEKNRGA